LATLRKAELGFFRRGGVHAGAHATTLRAILHRRRFGFRHLDLAAMANELIDRWHFGRFPLKKSPGERSLTTHTGKHKTALALSSSKAEPKSESRKAFHCSSDA
jgi:hypothetical protein